MLWAVELEKRGAWHYHCLIHLPAPKTKKESRERRKWISCAWADTVAGVGCKPDPDHVKAGTKLERIRNADDMARYVSKATSKRIVGELTPYYS